MAGMDNILVAKNKDFIRGTLVAVLVGDEKERCFVHKRLIQRRALNLNKFKTPAFGEYLYPRTGVPTFELYVHHLYTGEIQCRIPSKNWDTEIQEEILVDLYNLAHDLGDDITKHAVLKAFLEEAKRSRSLGRDIAPSQSTFNKVNRSLSFDEPLCHLLIDLCVWEKEFDVGLYEGIPAEFTIEVLKRACEKLQKGDTKSVIDKTCCDYRALKDNQQCGTKKRKRSEAEE